jgi:ribosome biogenesis GTPase A
VDSGLQLMDTAGILWPKFEDPQVGMMLAYTGAVKEGVIDVEELAYFLMELLHKYYPQTLIDRYKVEAPEGTRGWELMEMAGRKRGYLMARGEINLERMAKVLLDEFRSGKLGRFTLEEPEEEING